MATSHIGDVSQQFLVFDVLGNGVAILVLEEKPAGEYEVEFSRGLTGGRADSLIPNERYILLPTKSKKLYQNKRTLFLSPHPDTVFHI